MFPNHYLDINVILCVINVFAQLVRRKWITSHLCCINWKLACWSSSTYRGQFIQCAFNLHKVSLQKRWLVSTQTSCLAQPKSVQDLWRIITSSNISSSSTSFSSWTVVTLALLVLDTFEPMVMVGEAKDQFGAPESLTGEVPTNFLDKYRSAMSSSSSRSCSSSSLTYIHYSNEE